MENRIYQSWKSGLTEKSTPQAPVPQPEQAQQESWQSALKDPKRILGQHPAVTLGVGLCAGILLGCWVKRT